ncbi:MAG: manganese efflux pump [Dehalococcoidaceae bacterium]|nr:manganese efflux pump [Dehalococcoidaceae bacterium]
MPELNLDSILLIALGLSADCFAVSLGISPSCGRLSLPAVARVAVSFGLFQGMMPVAGWLIGRSVLELLAPVTGWVAFGLLAFIGARMLWQAIRGKDEHPAKTDYTRGWPLVVLAVATSIDALAAGLGFALLETSVLQAGLIIALTALLASATGMIIGNHTGRLLGRGAEIAGGLILLTISVRILIDTIA